MLSELAYLTCMTDAHRAVYDSMNTPLSAHASAVVTAHQVEFPVARNTDVLGELPGLAHGGSAVNLYRKDVFRFTLFLIYTFFRIFDYSTASFLRTGDQQWLTDTCMLGYLKPLQDRENALGAKVHIYGFGALYDNMGRVHDDLHKFTKTVRSFPYSCRPFIS